MTVKCDRLLSGQEPKQNSVAPPVKRQQLAGNILIKKIQEMGRTNAKVTDDNRCTACSQRNDRSPEGASLGNVKPSGGPQPKGFYAAIKWSTSKGPSVGLQIRTGRLHRPSGGKAARMAGDSHFRRFLWPFFSVTETDELGLILALL